MNEINLVDAEGNRIGQIDKLEAHVKGELHEAFSIFIFNNKKELLLQRRAMDKYHSGGLWTNTCCSHPKVGEDIKIAVHRRLLEEMGFDAEMKEVFSFTYKAEGLANNLIEHEFDHVFVGFVETINVNPNPEEVAQYKWTSLKDLEADVTLSPEKYTTWLQIILENKKLEKILN